MISRLYSILLMGMLALSLTTSVGMAQETASSINGILRYIRNTANGAEIITLEGTERFAYPFPSVGCSRLSSNGQFIAHSSETDDLLTITDVVTKTVVFETKWSSFWKQCSFFFSSLDQDLILIEATNETQFYLVNFKTGFMTTSPNSPGITIDYSHLPHLAWNQWVLPAPDGHHYFYARCTNGEITVEESIPYGFVACSAPMEWVIFDVVQADSIVVEETSETMLVDQFLTLAGAAWSPNTHYLAYLGYSWFPLRVLDRETNQLLDTDFVVADIDKTLGLYWSPDGHKLAMWVWGRLGDPEPQDPPLQYLRHLVIYDVLIEDYIVADSPDEIIGRSSSSGPVWNPQNGFWSPDSQTFVFTDKDGGLVMTNATSGATVILDDHVSEIISWVDSSVSNSD